MSAAQGGSVTVAKVGEIPVGGRKLVRIDDQPIAIFHLADGFYAIDDVCTHDGGPVAEGPLEGDEIECPRHGARFSVKTGEALCFPATAPVQTYAVQIAGEELRLAVDASGMAIAGGVVVGASGPAGGAAAGPAPVAAVPGVHGAAAGGAAGAEGTAAVPGPAAPAAPHAAPGAAAPSQQELAIRSALETVMDPEIALSVIDLGLIREVRVEPGKTLIKMMMTTPFCPYAPQLIEDVKRATMSVVAQECEVDLLPDPWSPDLMPDPGLLGYSY
jgi:3-phenylpropionate/trans-cinnamate dioxygenase ferredoxin subunit